jgi:hypothetical protein
MGHLSSEQLIDLAEGVELESSAPHLESCSLCRQQLADTRAAMAAVNEVSVPEPSPLFWDHFSARVHEAVEAERASNASRGSWSWLTGRPAWAGGLALAAVAVVLLVRAGHAPRSQEPSASSVSVTEGKPLTDEPGTFDDPSLSLVLDLAGELDWDQAREAGLTTHVGVDDDALAQLSDAERLELQKLLKGELAHRGA